MGLEDAYARELGRDQKKNKLHVCFIGSAYGGEERRMQGFGGETWGKETTWETQA